jgi:protein involved in plasmid replication-relaxation
MPRRKAPTSRRRSRSGVALASALESARRPAGALWRTRVVLEALAATNFGHPEGDEIKQRIPTPDGRGIYRANGGRIFFDLEWDRATESLQRMRQKIASYVAYFKHYRDADKNHVLFVVPNDEREDSLQYETWRGRPNYSVDTCCRYCCADCR